MLRVTKTQFEDLLFDEDLIRQEDLRKLTGFKSQGHISQLLRNKRSNPRSKRSKKESRKKLRDAIIEYHRIKGIPLEFAPSKDNTRKEKSTLK